MNTTNNNLFYMIERVTDGCGFGLQLITGVALDLHLAWNWFPDAVISARNDPPSRNPI